MARRRRRRNRRKRRNSIFSSSGSRKRLPANSPTQRVRLGFPQSMKATLRYTSELGRSFNPAAGAAGSFVVSANGMFDPSISGVGHQPRGFDQYMLAYNHYTVIASKIIWYASNLNTSQRLVVGIKVSDVTTIDTVPDSLIESGLIVYKLLGSVTSSRSNATLIYPLSISKFMGRPNIMSEDDLRGNAAANPSEGVFFHLVAFEPDNNDHGAVQCYFTIDYVAVFTEPKSLPQS